MTFANILRRFFFFLALSPGQQLACQIGIFMPFIWWALKISLVQITNGPCSECNLLAWFADLNSIKVWSIIYHSSMLGAARNIYMQGSLLHCISPGWFFFSFPEVGKYILKSNDREEVTEHISESVQWNALFWKGERIFIWNQSGFCPTPVRMFIVPVPLSPTITEFSTLFFCILTSAARSRGSALPQQHLQTFTFTSSSKKP